MSRKTQAMNPHRNCSNASRPKKPPRPSPHARRKPPMQADDHAVEVILSEARRFMVPLYQRKYQWGDERLGPFWEDVEAKAAEVLDGDSKFQHYMGALILAPIDEGSRIGVTPRVQVVDGQQRLTTFQLLLAAIREVARDHGADDVIAYVQDYILNPLKSKDTDPLTRFKLTPTPSDREIFHDVLEKEYKAVRVKYHQFYYGQRVPKNTPWRSLRAYDEFRKRVDYFVKFGPSDIEAPELEDIEDGEGQAALAEERLEALLKAVLNRMKLVVITLGEGDDAQVIFETLNSKGEPLLAMDLVRNNIFHRAEKEETSIDALYKELWDPFDDYWWRANAPNARPSRPRIDHFLAHVLAAETGEKISMRELYAEYRGFAVPKGRPRFEKVEDELRLLQRHAPIYETLEGRIKADPAMAWLGKKLGVWQVTTAYPLAMQIAASELADGDKMTLARLIYSYIVRRALSGLTAKNLNKVFQSLTQRFVEDGVSLEVFTAYFAGRDGDSTRFPNDEEFQRGILSQPAYRLAPSARIKDVLWELENASKSALAERVEMPDGLQTEHVLPQSWTSDWPFEDAVDRSRYDGDPASEERDRMLHTLGNLTLITGGLNISSGNKSFAEKKAKFAEHTGLFLNKWFVNKEAWAEGDIRQRGEHLALAAPKIWIGLEESK
ncbi:DUF262 domain-containing protein [Pseudosulfitobacter pseudonitzschiae]|uniref:DUF262 domain-containing protein n=1 Tax=Pseudosulfitobacter pseudonitzschiae TaxID=1402135 RepID=UPI001E60C030|nr:DUF262 domain-containing protein [Pseudosulfitobacter pseudonitzschiae]UFE99230.1 DUF262 domain-containing protein [Pseudosulfitobacter pseudonitzschiae]UFF12563.1 DUF262 domain-containing protein [Pseudosulfitobacter pseudonitzschiae]UFF18611.1 DUF262 domain-containing protein [Pseudosulfitobacter pseudonitzschiae]UFF22586.1 DUF262 domain-containing protein [Pseudosulfitobacter pseudonitzschiae]UFF60074.1 DUF262 domain-containing protein [Pseudosulfitobacter pseudonitzschiae]